MSGISWGMDDLVIPPEKKKILKEAENEIALIRKQYQDGSFNKFRVPNKNNRGLGKSRGRGWPKSSSLS